MDFGRLIVFIISIAGGLAIIKNRLAIVNVVGKSSWAERYLGMGGTFTMWTLIGVGIIVIGFLYFMGVVNFSPQEVDPSGNGGIQIIQ